jgi:endonuclease YncB( thermonuclease family)
MAETNPIFLRKPENPPSKRSLVVSVAGALVLFVVAAVLMLSPRTAAAEATPKTVSGTASVIDGDTIDIHGERIRLNAIDAPESGQKCLDAAGRFVRCGADAANALDAWINRNPVTCTVTGKDRYKRLLAECSVRGDSMQAWMVTNGHAVAYRAYSKDYVPAENVAKRARAGVWAGRFVYPWDWRKGARLPGEKPTKAMLEGKVASN